MSMSAIWLVLSIGLLAASTALGITAMITNKSTYIAPLVWMAVACGFFAVAAANNETVATTENQDT